VFYVNTYSVGGGNGDYMLKKLLKNLVVFSVIISLLWTILETTQIKVECFEPIIITTNSETVIKTGPGRNYKTLVTVPKDTKLVAVDKPSKNWYKVVVDKSFGYVSTKLVTIAETSAKQTKAVPKDERTVALEAFDAMNANRATKGIPLLVWNEYLYQAASIRAREIYQKFSHTRPNGSGHETAIYEKGIVFNTAGETIANGYMDGPGVVNDWLGSYKHKEILESPYMTSVGIGVYFAPDGSIYYSASFIG